VHRGTIEHDQERIRLGRGVVEDGVERVLIDRHLVGDDLPFVRVVDLKKDELGRVDANGSGERPIRLCEEDDANTGMPTAEKQRFQILRRRVVDLMRHVVKNQQHVWRFLFAVGLDDAVLVGYDFLQDGKIDRRKDVAFLNIVRHGERWIIQMKRRRKQKDVFLE